METQSCYLVFYQKQKIETPTKGCKYIIKKATVKTAARDMKINPLFFIRKRTKFISLCDYQKLFALFVIPTKFIGITNIGEIEYQKNNQEIF